MNRRGIAALGAVLALVVGTATVSAASPAPATLGLLLTPAPIHLDDGTRTLTATNLSGGLPLTVALVADPPTYTVSPATFTLPVDGSQVVTITAVDPSRDGTLSATGTADVAGAVRSAVNLRTRLLHRTFMEQVLAAIGGPGGSYVPLLALVALLLALCALWAIRRRHHGMSSAEVARRLR
jgi:hypothetical protein